MNGFLSGKVTFHSPLVTALVVYEYIITLGEEISLVWRGRVTGAVVLFVLNRYLNLGVVIYQFMTTFIVLDAEVS